MKKAVKAILNVLSYGGIEVESARRLADIKKLDPIRIFLRKLDMEIYNGDYKVPIRLFFPDEKMEESRFFTEYTVLTEDKDYQKYVRQLLADYWKYISLKMTGEDGEVAAAYTDYPVHLDEDYAESLEEQKEEWFQEAAEESKRGRSCVENVELALEAWILRSYMKRG